MRWRRSPTLQELLNDNEKTNTDNDGNIYLKHYGTIYGFANQLMRVNNDKMQYCAGATAPFKVMPYLDLCPVPREEDEEEDSSAAEAKQKRKSKSRSKSRTRHRSSGKARIGQSSCRIPKLIII